MNKLFYLMCFLFFTNPVIGQTVKINGIVKNSLDTIIVFHNNQTDAITGLEDRYRYKAKVDKNGSFSIILPERSIDEWSIEIDEVYTLTHLIASQDVYLSIDCKDEQNAFKATGQGGNEFNYYLYAFKKLEEKYSSSEIKIQQNSMSLRDGMTFRKKIANYQLEILEGYRKLNPISDTYYNWLKAYYKYYPYERIEIEKLISLDSSKVALLTENGIDDDYAAENSIEYNKLVNIYAHQKFNGNRLPLNLPKFFDFIVEENILTGKTKDVFLTKITAQLCDLNDSIFKPIYNKYLKIITDKKLIALVDKERGKYSKALEESRISKENVSNAIALNEIFEKYRGKVIYLDFWASWCGPCKAEMPDAKKLQDKLKNKDIVFLYFGYQDQKENWLKSRQELEIIGEHVLLNTQLIQEARNLFEISGIPHHAIIDRNGKIITKHADRPISVYNDLIKLLQ